MWMTIKVTRRHREGPFAVMPDGHTYYTPEALLLQTDASGKTRTVLGYRVGVHILAADEIEGWQGQLAGDIHLRADGERIRSVPAWMYEAS